LDGERQQQHAPAHRFIDVVEPRLVIADDPQLERGHEVEEVLPHEAGGYPVATGERLDLDLIPGTAFLGLLGNDQSMAVQLGEIGGMALGLCGEESCDIGDGRILAHDPEDGACEGRLAVGAGAIGEDELVLAGAAGHAVAAPAFEERAEFLVGSNLFEECIP
jgi:hypothetical protein